MSKAPTVELSQHEKAAIYYQGYGPNSPYSLEYWLANVASFKQAALSLPKGEER